HRQESVVSYRRIGKNESDEIIVILNFTPVERKTWKVSLPSVSSYREIFNSDHKDFWGTGEYLNSDLLDSKIEPKQQAFYIEVNLPPLGGIVLKRAK
ncbi:MAG: alpha amylase C-terminal domain-containing protein, partial [Chitinophagaceae bacterium]